MIKMEVDTASERHLVNILHKLGKLFPDEVVKMIHREGLIIESDAKRRLVKDLVNSPKKKDGRPYYYGRLSSSVHNIPFKTGVTVGTNVKYAPYVEFGTGDGVKIPTGWETYAAKYKGRGVRKVNNRARPFLVAAYIHETPLIMAKVVTLCKKNMK